MGEISWFSAGVSSAVATKLALKDNPELTIVYIDIDDQHPDTQRFIGDCENWYGKKIMRLKSKYASVENACLSFGYINGVGGARCTLQLKKRVRKQWEKENKPSTYIWGMDCSKKEIARADRIVDNMTEYNHKFPLIEQNIDKTMAHGLLEDAGIKRPAMYDLGYPNNNCIGCVKGGMGYWNKIRKDFPEVFDKRAKMERIIGASCIKGIYLDELPEGKGNVVNPIVEDCGLFCGGYSFNANRSL